MSEQEHSSPQPNPVPEGYKTWNEYWTRAHNQPWRTKPEIPEERQRELDRRRREIAPDVEKSVYPFKDVKLDRADVEWLLATHESDGMRGPVDWDDVGQRKRIGLDVRGADLSDTDLQALPLARLHGGLFGNEWDRAVTHQHQAASVQLSRSNLTYSRLEGSILTYARLDGAALRTSHLEAADAFGIHLEGVDMRSAFLDTTTKVENATLVTPHGVGPRVVDVHWDGANLAPANWRSIRILGDEQWASQRRMEDGSRKDRQQRLIDSLRAVRAARQLAHALRAQGLNEDSDRFAYRANVLQRHVLLRRFQILQYLGSLFLDLIAGYGYRPLRSFIAYVLVILGFAAAYFALGGANGQALSWNETIVISMTAFHGRGFFQTTYLVGDPQAAVAAVEAFFGLLLEIVLIATFTQRFFAR